MYILTIFLRIVSSPSPPRQNIQREISHEATYKTDTRPRHTLKCSGTNDTGNWKVKYTFGEISALIIVGHELATPASGPTSPVTEFFIERPEMLFFIIYTYVWYVSISYRRSYPKLTYSYMHNFRTSQIYVHTSSLYRCCMFVLHTFFISLDSICCNNKISSM